MPPLILGEKDVNASATSNQQQQQASADGDSKGDIKSMEYHRQVLQSKLQNGFVLFHPIPQSF